jgi:hypothetical protein
MEIYAIENAAQHDTTIRLQSKYEINIRDGPMVGILDFETNEKHDGKIYKESKNYVSISTVV